MMSSHARHFEPRVPCAWPGLAGAEGWQIAGAEGWQSPRSQDPGISGFGGSLQEKSWLQEAKQGALASCGEAVHFARQLQPAHLDICPHRYAESYRKHYKRFYSIGLKIAARVITWPEKLRTIRQYQQKVSFRNIKNKES